MSVETPFGSVETTKDPADAARNLGVDLYPGAELMRNGSSTATFGGVHTATISAESSDPVDQVFNFYKAKYTSKYLTFTPVEQETVAEKPLEKLTSAQTALITKYDAPPYVSSSDEGAIPFIDFGGKYFVHGAQYDPQVLSGQSWAQVAASLKDPSSAIAKGADGAANMITATICKTTNNQPSNVCTTPTIKTIEGQI